jgi:hypothetical protein
MNQTEIIIAEFESLGYFEKNTIKSYTLFLGTHLVNQYPGPRRSVPYVEKGKELWEAFKRELYKIICENGKPREWVNDLITGDIRNLVVGFVQLITAKYDVSIAIAVPVAALYAKTGILVYCEMLPVKSEKSVRQILDETEKSYGTKHKGKNKGSKKKKKKRKD